MSLHCAKPLRELVQSLDLSNAKDERIHFFAGYANDELAIIAALDRSRHAMRIAYYDCVH